MKGVKSENVRPPPPLPPCEVEGRGASLDNKLSGTYLQGFVTLGSLYVLMSFFQQ